MWIALWKKPACWSERNNANFKERKIVDMPLLLVKGYIKLEKVWIELARVLICIRRQVSLVLKSLPAAILPWEPKPICVRPPACAPHSE